MIKANFASEMVYRREYAERSFEKVGLHSPATSGWLAANYLKTSSKKKRKYQKGKIESVYTSLCKKEKRLAGFSKALVGAL